MLLVIMELSYLFRPFSHFMKISNKHVKKKCSQHLYLDSTIHLSKTIFITALLKYNSHTITFAHLKGTVHWFLGYSQISTTQ